MTNLLTWIDRATQRQANASLQSDRYLTTRATAYCLQGPAGFRDPSMAFPLNLRVAPGGGPLILASAFGILPLPAAGLFRAGPSDTSITTADVMPDNRVSLSDTAPRDDVAPKAG